VAFAARPPTNLLATASVSAPAAWRRDLWEQKWQTAHDDNAQMAAQLLNYVFYAPA